MMQKRQKMTKLKSRGDPALNFALGLSYDLSKFGDDFTLFFFDIERP